MKWTSENLVMQFDQSTRTVNNFGKVLGNAPHKLNKMAVLYKDYTIDNFIGALNNIYNEKTPTKTYTRINSREISWDIEIRQTKKIYFADDHASIAADTSVTSGRKPFKVRFKERWFNKNEVLRLTNNQQLRVLADPRPAANGSFEYTVVLQTSDMSQRLDARQIRTDKFAVDGYNLNPEISERGYVKRFGQTESHRNWMSTIRHSVDWTSDYALREKHWVQEDDKVTGRTSFFFLNGKEKEVLDAYKLSREWANLIAEHNYDPLTGKCLDFDEAGQPIPSGDGILTQVRRYCEKHDYPRDMLSTSFLDDVIESMQLRDPSKEKKGNEYTFMCNTRFDRQFGNTIKADLRFISADGGYYWSRDSKAEVKIGANFKSYEMQGNTITIVINAILDEQFPDRAYAIALNPKPLANGEPTLAGFTFGSELVSGQIDGLGGQNGETSGKIVTSTTVSSYHLVGTAGVVYYNPYHSYELREDLA